jgi:hypothetical protein
MARRYGFRSAILAGLALCLAAAPALTQEYPFDVAKHYPSAMRSWQAIVPADFRKQVWIYRLDGTSGDMENVTLHGRVFLYGSVCIPHDCGGNFVAFLVAKDGGEAFGALASNTLGVTHRFFGAPDAEARDLLDRKLAQ